MGVTNDYGVAKKPQYQVIEQRGRWRLLYDQHELHQKCVHEFRIQHQDKPELEKRLLDVSLEQAKTTFNDVVYQAMREKLDSLMEQRQYWMADSAAAWDKCEERRLEAEASQKREKQLREALEELQTEAGSHNISEHDGWARCSPFLDIPQSTLDKVSAALGLGSEVPEASAPIQVKQALEGLLGVMTFVDQSKLTKQQRDIFIQRMDQARAVLSPEGDAK